MIRAAIALLLLATLCRPAGTAEAADAFASEGRIKAACLYNFLRFTEWPEEGRGDSITIGIVGKNPFGGSFDAVRGQTVGRHEQTLHIRSLDRTQVEDLRSCEILFVTESEPRLRARILEGVRGAPVLTVSDQAGFLESGGMIQLVTRNQRIRWRIHLPSVRAVGLTLSSQLLRTAEQVLTGEED